MSVLKSLFDAIDSAADIGKKPQSSNILAFRLERIKHLADQYREVAYWILTTIFFVLFWKEPEYSRSKQTAGGHSLVKTQLG